MRRNITRFTRWLLAALKRAHVSESSRFYFSSCSKWCPFTFTHAHNRFFHWRTASLRTFCDMLPHVSMGCCFNSPVSRHLHHQWRHQYFEPSGAWLGCSRNNHRNFYINILNWNTENCQTGVNAHAPRHVPSASYTHNFIRHQRQQQ